MFFVNALASEVMRLVTTPNLILRIALYVFARNMIPSIIATPLAFNHHTNCSSLALGVCFDVFASMLSELRWLYHHIFVSLHTCARIELRADEVSLSQGMQWVP